MSNVIKPKRGSTDPAPGVLAEGEIGINTSAATAFIGVAGGSSKKLNAARSEETDSVDTSGEATANGNRHIWFSDLDNEKVRAYNGNFQYNPATNAISSNVSGTSSNVTGIVSIAHGGTGATTRQDAAFNILGGNTYTGDLNDNTDVGVFWVNLSSCTNGPASSGFGILQMVKASSGLRQQTFTFYSSGEIWVRTYANSQWYNWYAAAKLSDEYLIRYQDIPDGANLNNNTYKIPGHYRSIYGINKISNVPSDLTSGAFELIVTGISNSSYCTQTVKDISNNKSWVRTQTTWQTPWSWTNWAEIITTDTGSSYYARLQSSNNLIEKGNEFNFAAPGHATNIYLNYRTSSGAKDGNITEYEFGNGKGGYAPIRASAVYATSFRWVKLWSGKLQSGSATIPNAAKYAAILVSGHPGSEAYRTHICLPTGSIDAQMVTNMVYMAFNTTYSNSSNDCTISITHNSNNGNIDYVWGLVQYRS